MLYTHRTRKLTHTELINLRDTHRAHLYTQKQRLSHLFGCSYRELVVAEIERTKAKLLDYEGQLEVYRARARKRMANKRAKSVTIKPPEDDAVIAIDKRKAERTAWHQANGGALDVKEAIRDEVIAQFISAYYKHHESTFKAAYAAWWSQWRVYAIQAKQSVAQA